MTNTFQGKAVPARRGTFNDRAMSANKKPQTFGEANKGTIKNEDIRAFSNILDLIDEEE